MVSTPDSLHQRDPYESQFLTFGPSGIDGAGLGVFLRRDVTKGTVMGFYNGVRMSDFESKLRRADRTSPYRMDNDWAEEKQVRIFSAGYRLVHFMYRIPQIIHNGFG